MPHRYVRLLVAAAALSLFATPSFAQLVIDRGDVEALIGQTVTLTSYAVDPVLPGQAEPLIAQAGANQTWNLAGFAYTPTDVSTQSWVSSTAGLEGASSFPDADFAVVDRTGEVDYANSFIDLQEGGLYWLGFAGNDEGTDVVAIYQPPLIQMPFPFTYGATWNGSSSYDAYVDGVGNVTITETVDGVVDGWGSLTLPHGTFQTLRYRMTLTMDIAGFVSTSTLYVWVTDRLTEAAIVGVTTITIPGMGEFTTYSIDYSQADAAAPTAPTAAPAGLFPQDGTTGVTTTPVFTWGTVSGATAYDVEIATDAAFSNVVESGADLLAAAFLPSTLQGGTTYWWRVRGRNAGGAGPWAEASFSTASGTAIELLEGALPDAYALIGNYPNPFNPSTRIRFDLPESAHARLRVYTMLGQPVATLVDGVLPAGRHEAGFEAAGLPSGAYLYRLEAGGTVTTRVMTLLK